MLLVIFVYCIAAFNRNDQSIEDKLAQKIVDAAVDEALDADAWYAVLKQGEMKLQEFMRNDHPAIELLSDTAEIIKRDEWCGAYMGAAGKQELICDLEVFAS